MLDDIISTLGSILRAISPGFLAGSLLCNTIFLIVHELGGLGLGHDNRTFEARWRTTRRLCITIITASVGLGVIFFR